MNNTSFIYPFLVIVIGGCTSSANENIHLFELVSANHSNITFNNTIEENDSLHILSYEYLYNGGGVGVLDVNNDDLPDLFFTGNQTKNALYINKGDLNFQDISEFAGIEFENQWCTGVAIIDINNDGFDDIYLSVGGPGNQDIHPNKLLINQQDNTFKESAAEYGLNDKGESIQAAFFDYDLDGDLDMYLLTGGGFERSAIVVRPILTDGSSRNTDRLYENVYDSTLGHPVFKNVSKAAGILTEGFGLGVAILDANQDQWPDVYVSNDYISKDLLYINNQDGTFTDQSLKLIKHTSHFSMGNDAGDINNDGLMDIITVDMLPENHLRKQLMSGPDNNSLFQMALQQGYGHQHMRNMLQLNHGNGFSEIGQLAGVHRTDWSWAPLLADFDNDGFQDLYVTNGFGKDVTDLDFVNFRKDAVSAFADKEKARKLLLDSLKARPSVIIPNYIFKNEGGLTFSNQSRNWGIDIASLSNGAAYADLDNDGDLEIIVNNINQQTFIFKNKVREQDSVNSNSLKISLNGSGQNRAGIGATVNVYTGGVVQTKYVQPSRGFQSSVEKTLFFGLKQFSKIDSVVVLWPDGRKSLNQKIEANQLLNIYYKESFISPARQPVNQQKYFTEVELLDFLHQETSFNDFKIQSLLQHGFSNLGPEIAVADVNIDGLQDLFIGGAYGTSGSIFLQASNGSFIRKDIKSEAFEDVGAIFFEANGDDFPDLYVTSGGSERYEGHINYQDRLYINQGNGNFLLEPSALPEMLTSTSVVRPADFDLDGDQDLFVAGRVVPGKYPQAPESYLLENRNGAFYNVTSSWSKELQFAGMVTSAIWLDVNKDERPDLIIAGEFMPITVFENKENGLFNITHKSGLQSSEGIWSSLIAADFDNDGDQDLVAGNIGYNTAFKVKEQEPLQLFYADFDGNSTIDPIFSAYEEGNSYPIASLNLLGQQLPKLKKKLLKYRDFAQASSTEVLQILAAEHRTLSCKVAATSFIENIGNGQFKISPLPVEAQVAPTNTIIAEDLNHDGFLDLILAGNNYNREVIGGRYDASIGNVLLNNGSNTFKALTTQESGFFVGGDARSMARITVKDHLYLLIAQNNSKLLSYRISPKQHFPELQLSKSMEKISINNTNSKLTQ